MKALMLLTVLFAGLGCEKKEAETACAEKPNNTCVCTYEYKLVCGCNGKTYGNACEASCVGITFTEGACSGG